MQLTELKLKLDQIVSSSALSERAEQTRRALSEDSEALAAWLKEVGKRRRPTPLEIPPCRELGKGRARVTSSGYRRIVSLSVATVACLQYVYADTVLDILSLPSLIVFVLTAPV